MSRRRRDEERTEHISPEMIRDQVNKVTGEVAGTAAELRQPAIAAGAVLLALLLILVFLFGRSRGRKRTTVVEIIRV